MRSPEDEVVIPVVGEEVKADAVPKETGGVRVTKHVHSHDEVVEQELRTGRVDVKHVHMNRPVDGPLPGRLSSNTVVVPFVSEVVRVERQWILTEEIHLTRREEVRTVQQTVPVKQESATAERVNAAGDVVETIADQPEERERSESVLHRRAPQKAERVLSKRPKRLRNRPSAGDAPHRKS